jgi:hypothetical protein
MKRTALSLLIALSAFAVQAQAPADPVAPADTAEAVPAAADADTQDAPEAVADKTHERNCIRETGSRIKRRDRDGCNGQPGESYTGEELRRTGASNPAEALRLLSPRVGG